MEAIGKWASTAPLLPGIWPDMETASVGRNNVTDGKADDFRRAVARKRRENRLLWPPLARQGELICARKPRGTRTAFMDAWRAPVDAKRITWAA